MLDTMWHNYNKIQSSDFTFLGPPNKPTLAFSAFTVKYFSVCGSHFFIKVKHIVYTSACFVWVLYLPFHTLPNGDREWGLENTLFGVVFIKFKHISTINDMVVCR
jgi:hypothetical protein